MRSPLPVASLAAGIVAAVLWSSAASAQSCPSATLDPSEIALHVARAPSCGAAVNVLRACQRGSSGDVRVARQVVAKCERTFLSGLSSAEAASYARDKEACRRRHAGRQGAEFSSFSGFCEAETALRYSRR